MEHISKLMAQAVSQEPVRPESLPLKTGEQNRFAAAVEKQKIKDCPLEALKGVLRMVMLKVGIRAANLPDEEEKAVLIGHILTEYSGHTPEEIVLAFDMAITGKLDVDATPYENFSCLYFSNIMNAYRLWAVQEYRQIKSEPTNHKQLVYSINPKKELEELIEMMRVDYKAGKLKDEFVMPSIYDKMLEHGMIQLPLIRPTLNEKRDWVITHIKE